MLTCSSSGTRETRSSWRNFWSAPAACPSCPPLAMTRLSGCARRLSWPRASSWPPPRSSCTHTGRTRSVTWRTMVTITRRKGGGRAGRQRCDQGVATQGTLECVRVQTPPAGAPARPPRLPPGSPLLAAPCPVRRWTRPACTRGRPWRTHWGARPQCACLHRARCPPVWHLSVCWMRTTRQLALRRARWTCPSSGAWVTLEQSHFRVPGKRPSHIPRASWRCAS
mmetsp:Transcript_27365/g.59863  ORF Transcript_27365/g.59863 Transcript_27365/m.59863 type:complete len:224 (-) Transcript_27365:1087-1758(-)